MHMHAQPFILIFLARHTVVSSTWQINMKTNKTFFGWEQIDRGCFGVMPQQHNGWLSRSPFHFTYMCVQHVPVRPRGNVHFCFFPLLSFFLPAFLSSLPSSHLQPPIRLFPTLSLCCFFPLRPFHQWPEIALGASSSIGSHRDHQLTFLALLLPPPFHFQPFLITLTFQNVCSGLLSGLHSFALPQPSHHPKTGPTPLS